jgi:hypothetical protein
MSAIDEVVEAAVGAKDPTWENYFHWRNSQPQGPGMGSPMSSDQFFGTPGPMYQAGLAAQQGQQAAQQSFQDYLQPPVVGENVPPPPEEVQAEPSPVNIQGAPDAATMQAASQVGRGPSYGPQPINRPVMDSPTWSDLINEGMIRLLSNRQQPQEQRQPMLPMQGGREDGYRR